MVSKHTILSSSTQNNANDVSKKQITTQKHIKTSPKIAQTDTFKTKEQKDQITQAKQIKFFIFEYIASILLPLTKVQT